jgi:hypothetical protein
MDLDNHVVPNCKAQLNKESTVQASVATMPDSSNQLAT